MVRIAVCDDISIHCDIVKKEIKKYFSGKNIAYCIDTYLTGTSLLSSDIHYDLLIMDIALKKENGLQVARKYAEGKRTRIILLSSHTEELPNGYKIGAFRFLTKPIQKQNLEEALDSAIESLGEDRWLTCFDQYRREHSISLPEIFCIEACHRKCFISTKDTTYDCFFGIRQISDWLPSRSFFQTHRSYIVNLNYIQSLKGSTLELSNGLTVPVSRSNIAAFREKYQDYIRSDHYGY